MEIANKNKPIQLQSNLNMNWKQYLVINNTNFTTSPQRIKSELKMVPTWINVSLILYLSWISGK